jgi:hypothetical protein
VRDIVLGPEAHSALGAFAVGALRKMLGELDPVLAATCAEPFDLYRLFAVIDLPEPSLDDVFEASALLAEDVHPLELLLYFAARRPASGDIVGELLEVVASIVERRGPRIRRLIPRGELTNEGDVRRFVRRAYRLILRKEVDDDGLSYFTQALLEGAMTRDSALDALVASDIARARQITVV